MRLSVARLCLDCEEIHEGAICPVCSSETFAFLKRWVPASATEAGSSRSVQEKGPQVGDLAQLQRYEQLLKPSHPRSRKRGLIAGGALGLAVLGVTRLAWRLGKARKPNDEHGEDL